MLEVLVLGIILGLLYLIYKNYNGWHEAYVNRRLSRFQLKEKRTELQIKKRDFVQQERRAEMTHELERQRLQATTQDSKMNEKFTVLAKMLELELLKLQFLSSNKKNEAEEKMLQDMDNVLKTIHTDSDINGKF